MSNAATTSRMTAASRMLRCLLGSLAVRQASSVRRSSARLIGRRPPPLPSACASKRLSPLERAFDLHGVAVLCRLLLGHAPGSAAALSELVGVFPQPEKQRFTDHARSTLAVVQCPS